MMPSSTSADVVNVCTESRCSTVSSLSSSDSHIPRTPLSGVRTSWLRLARNSPLARLAVSATFLASANCCEYVGADPYFVDIDDETLTIDPNEVERHIKVLKAAGRRVRAIMGVDLAGHACDWASLRTIANKYDLELVDDACHAMGGTYGGVKVGSCVDNDLTILSFHPVKHITTAEGGAVLTNDPALAEHARRLRSHGTVRGAEAIAEWDGPWMYDMIELGYNFRLSDLQAALGSSQMRKIDRFLARRREIAAAYNAGLPAARAMRRPTETPGVQHAYHLYVARADFDRLGTTRHAFFEQCAARGIHLQVHYRPVSDNTYFRNKPGGADAIARVPVANRFYQQAFSMPMHPQLTDEDVARVVGTMKELLP